MSSSENTFLAYILLHESVIASGFVPKMTKVTAQASVRMSHVDDLAGILVNDDIRFTAIFSEHAIEHVYPLLDDPQVVFVISTFSASSINVLRNANAGVRIKPTTTFLEASQSLRSMRLLFLIFNPPRLILDK